jgi:hypothetical protein
MHNKYKVGKIRSDNRAKIIAIAEMEFAEFGYKGASIMNRAELAPNMCLQSIPNRDWVGLNSISN